jgi:uncharacterized protein YjbJ (UPF0337 family)
MAQHMLSEHLSEKVYKGVCMNNDVLRGKWMQLKGEVRSRWGKLTDDDITEIQGEAEKLIGKLQQRYGYKREQAQKELNEFLSTPAGQPRRTA